MKFHRTTSLCLIILMSAGMCTLGQSSSKNPLSLSRRNPDNWFSLRVPKVMGKVERFADVDGGFYKSVDFEIRYDYWTYENTPNFLRNAGGNYPKPPMLACSTKSRRTRTLQTLIDGKRAIIQRCSVTDARKGFHYIYYVTFPKLEVTNGEGFADGMFNLTVEYKNRRYLPIAEGIVRSIDFEK